MLRGATACMMSHRNVWQRIVDEKIPVALVLEDDAVVADFDSGMLDIDLERLELDLLRIALTQYERHFALGHLRDRHKSAVGRKTYHPVSGKEYGTAAYLVSLEGAVKLLKIKHNWFLIYHFAVWALVAGLRHAVLESPMFQQSASVSSIVESTLTDEKFLPLHKKLYRKYVRKQFNKYLRFPLILAFETRRFKNEMRLKKGGA